MAKSEKCKNKAPCEKAATDKPTQSPDLPPGSHYNLPPVQPERVTTQTARDLAKKPANQEQA